MLLAGNIKPIVHQRTITGVDALYGSCKNPQAGL